MSIRLDGIKEERVTDFMFFCRGILPRQLEALGIIIVYTEFSK